MSTSVKYVAQTEKKNLWKALNKDPKDNYQDITGFNHNDFFISTWFEQETHKHAPFWWRIWDFYAPKNRLMLAIEKSRI